jgi:hypothetical protein
VANRVVRDLEAVERGLLDVVAEVAICRRWADGITPLLPRRREQIAYADLAHAVGELRSRLGAVERTCRVLMADEEEGVAA